MRVESRRAFTRHTEPAGCQTSSSDELAQQCPKSRRSRSARDELHCAEPELDHDVTVQNANGRAGSPDPKHHADADRERRCWPPNASRRWIHILPPQHRAADRAVAPDPAAKWIRATPPSKLPGRMLICTDTHIQTRHVPAHVLFEVSSSELWLRSAIADHWGSVPVSGRTFHTRAVLSLLAVTTRVPSGLGSQEQRRGSLRWAGRPSWKRAKRRRQGRSIGQPSRG